MLLIPGFLFLNFLIRFIFENVFFTVFRSVWMLHIFVLNLNLFQQISQHRFNVVFRLVWRRNVAQRQINFESTLRTSELKFTTFNNVETTLCILKLNWTTLDNVGTTLSFSISIFTTFSKAETTLQIWQLKKKIKPRFTKKIIFLSFKEYAGLKIFFIFLHFKRNLQKTICRASKILQTSNILNSKKYI